MHNIKLPVIYFITLLTIVTASCKKTEDTHGLPKATQSGAKTLGFLLNGTTWTPKGREGMNQNLSMEYDPTLEGRGYLRVSAFNLKDDETFGANTSFSLFVTPIDGTGRYEADPTDGFPGAQFSVESTCTYDNRGGLVDGFVNITKLDKEARIISGTFEFTLKATYCYPEEENCPGCEDIKITEGRFDMPY
jgi:hypothetical protein